jgi:hypothetical protein
LYEALGRELEESILYEADIAEKLRVRASGESNH